MGPDNSDGNHISNSNNNPRVALVTALFLVAFCVFVFVYDDVKSLPFVQGFSGLVFTLGAAVILFSAVDSKAKIKGPIILGGAAAFFFIALPRIEPLIFPSHSINGTIYYVGTTHPVAGVSIRIPGTNQSTQTDVLGDFHMQSVPRHVTKLTANSGGEDHEFEINKGEKYAIIPLLPPPPVKSISRSIKPDEWEPHTQNKCQRDAKDKGRNVTLFIWRKKIPKEDDYTSLYVEVSAEGGSDFTQTAILAPENIGGDAWDAERLGNRDQHLIHMWLIPFVDKEKSLDLKELDVELAVCLANDGKPSASNNLSASYWFAK